MPAPHRPWRQRTDLAGLVAAWRAAVGPRDLFRVVVGPGWLRLHLAGDERPGLLHTTLAGAVLVCPFASPLPRQLHDALTPTVGDPLVDLLRDGRLDDLRLLADDLVLELQLTTPGGPRRLRHQLFGNRGGLVLLDTDHRMLYTAHPSPHPCLVEPTPTLAAPVAPADPRDLVRWSDVGLRAIARQREIVLGEGLQRAVGRRLESARRLVTNLTADLDRAEGGDQRRREAETLAAGLHLVRKGQDAVTLADPLDGTRRTIDLKPSLPPHANLERLFKQARKADRGREVIAERLDEAHQALALGTTLHTELTPLLRGPDDPDQDTMAACLRRLSALQDFRRAHPDQLSERETTGVQAPDQPTRPFRRYRIDDQWDVWVGRSSQENDELTHRASHPQDLWLHAQGVPGSHVILRTHGHPDQVPGHVLERAAALAALHSKARNSALVPVIYTQRRYVRKPRKAPAGTAVCLQEKSLFTEPEVKPGVRPA